MKAINFKSTKYQQGAVLIISLLILLVMTIVGVSSMQSVSLEERMAGNMRDNDMAFQAAEAALRGAETWLNDLVTIGSFGSSPGLYALEDDVDVSADAATWSSSITYGTSIPGLSEQPTYIIQYAGVIPGPGGSKNQGGYGRSLKYGEDVSGFEVTARGVGQTSNSVVILRTMYGIKL